jgi:hypothetical protein
MEHRKRSLPHHAETAVVVHDADDALDLGFVLGLLRPALVVVDRDVPADRIVGVEHLARQVAGQDDRLVTQRAIRLFDPAAVE